MSISTTSGTIFIPQNTRSLRVILKGEGGLGANLITVNCLHSNVGSGNGSCTQSFVGSGSSTTFLNSYAGGGEGGYYNNLNEGPGGTFDAPVGLVTGTNGNPGAPASTSAGAGGVGPGGDGTNGASSSYQAPGPLNSYCCGNPSVSYCLNSCCPPGSACGYPGGIAGGCCRCQRIVNQACGGSGGGAGAIVEFELTNSDLKSLGVLGTNQPYTVNEGASSLVNGSIETIFQFSQVYIKTSAGWQLCNNVWVKGGDTGWVGVGNSVFIQS